MNNLKQLRQRLNKVSTFQTPSFNSTDNILIVDGTNNFIRCISAIQNTNTPLIHAIQTFFYSIHNVINLYRPSKVYIVFDGKNNSAQRKTANSGYKQNRLKTQNIEDVIDQTKKFNKQQVISKLLLLIKSLPIILLVIDNIQADDTISFIVKKQNSENKKCIIMSTDKDFYQLLQKNVVYNPITKKQINKQYIVTTYNIIPQNFIYYKAICGDGSDNVQGIQGVGLKTFIKHYSNIFKQKQIINLTQSIQNIQNNKFKDKLKQNLTKVRDNIKLMDLTGTTFINKNNIASIQFIVNQNIERITSKQLFSMIGSMCVLCKNNNLFISKKYLNSYLYQIYQPIYIHLKTNK